MFISFHIQGLQACKCMAYYGGPQLSRQNKKSRHYKLNSRQHNVMWRQNTINSRQNKINSQQNKIIHGNTMLCDGKTKWTHGKTPLSHGKIKLTHGKTKFTHGKTKFTHGKSELKNVCACGKLVARLCWFSVRPVLFVRRFVCLVCAKKWTLELNGFIVILSFRYRNNKRSIAHGILTWRRIAKLE